MDAIDGKQARRTHCASSLDQLFDHGECRLLHQCGPPAPLGELATPKQQLVFKAAAIATRELVMRIHFCSAHVKAGVQRQYMVVFLFGSPGVR